MNVKSIGLKLKLNNFVFSWFGAMLNKSTECVEQ